MLSSLLWFFAYLLVGWLDAGYVHRVKHGRWSWEWICLAWPVRWVVSGLRPARDLSGYPRRPDQTDTPHV